MNGPIASQPRGGKTFSADKSVTRSEVSPFGRTEDNVKALNTGRGYGAVVAAALNNN